MFFLEKEELIKISDILAGIGHVCLGSIVIPFFLDMYDLRFALLGMLLACGSWWGSVYLVKRAYGVYY